MKPSRIRLALTAGVVALTTITLGACSGGSGKTTSKGVVKPQTMTDAAGDTVDHGTTNKVAVPAADSVAASADYRPDGITLTVKVKQPSDPMAGSKWGDATYVSWEVDTNHDSKPDYEIQYYVDSGQLTGDVTRVGAPTTDDPACDVSSAKYDAAAGYTVALDPKCIGNPAAFSYRVTSYYDTKPGDDNATVGSDVAPDTGFSAPINRPGAVKA
jgi:hypothetical protein